jgi:membrane protein YdbS with pleckstrin-like domain
MSKIVLFTIIFVILVIEVAAGTIWFSKWRTPNVRSRRVALLIVVIANLVLLLVMLPQMFRYLSLAQINGNVRGSQQTTQRMD